MKLSLTRPAVVNAVKNAAVKAPLLAVASLTGLLLSSCTTPQGEVAGDSVAASEERICRGAKSSGSRMARQTCRTADEWAIADAKEAQRVAVQEEFFRRAGEGSSLQQGPAFDSAAAAGP